VISNEAELAARTKRLPEMFADRVRNADLDGLRSMAGGGEWGELLDLLVAALRYSGSTISAHERDELCDLLAGWGLPTDQLEDLVVTH
jgi:hypothetical protein